MTRLGYRLQAAAVVLSVIHHIDHVLRGHTGWPVAGDVNAFSYSLLVYPVIAAGFLLARRGWMGSRGWALLAGGGAVFVIAVHLGPAAGDSIDRIAPEYSSPIAGTAAVVLLGAFVAVLVATSAYEWRVGGRPRRRLRVGNPA